MARLSIIQFLRICLIFSLVFGIFLCAVFSFFMAEAEYTSLIQDTRTLKQQEILELEVQAKDNFQSLKDRLLSAHTLGQQGPQERKWREEMRSLAAREKTTGIHHELVLLNKPTKRNFYRALRAYFAGKRLLPNLRGRSQICRRDRRIARQLRNSPIVFGVDKDLEKIWISSEELRRLDALDSKVDGVFEMEEFTRCFKRSMVKFHYDSFIHARVSNHDIQDFWKSLHEDKPTSFPQLLERQTRELPELFKSFTYLDLLLIGNTISNSVSLFSKGLRFDRFFQQRLRMDPAKALLEFVEIQGYWVHLQHYNRPWPTQPEHVHGLIADGVSLLKLDKDIPVFEMLKKAKSKGFATGHPPGYSPEIQVFSTLLNGNLTWMGWDSSKQWKSVLWYWLIIFAGILIFHGAIAHIAYRTLILPLEKNVQNLLEEKETGKIIKESWELGEIRGALDQMQENQTQFQEELLLRSACLQILQDARLSADQMLHEINEVLKSFMKGLWIERIDVIKGHNRLITIDPDEATKIALEQELKIQFPVHYQIHSGTSLPKSVLKICSETLENIYYSIHTHLRERLYLSRRDDLQATRSINELMLRAREIKKANLRLNIDVRFGEGLGSDGYEIIERPDALYVLIVSPQSSPPMSTLITHSLRSYLNSAGYADPGPQALFDQICAYAYGLARDTGIEQVFLLARIDSAHEIVEFAGKGEFFFRTLDLGNPSESWSSIHTNLKSAPDLLRKIVLGEETVFEAATSEYVKGAVSDGGIHLKVRKERAASV